MAIAVVAHTEHSREGAQRHFDDRVFDLQELLMNLGIVDVEIVQRGEDLQRLTFTAVEDQPV